MIVADEPVSALDVSVQAQVLNLMLDLRERHQLAYLFISHDLSIVRHMTENVAVMFAGRIVEQGPTQDLFEDPATLIPGIFFKRCPNLYLEKSE